VLRYINREYRGKIEEPSKQTEKIDEKQRKQAKK